MKIQFYFLLLLFVLSYSLSSCHRKNKGGGWYHNRNNVQIEQQCRHADLALSTNVLSNKVESAATP